MAQIIKHRRGSISALKDVTANIGEFVIATGSIGDLNAPVVFVGSDATAGGYRAVSKIYQGSLVPILGAGYGTTMDGTPFYSSTSQSLYILDRNGNINMDLSGNLEGNTISGITINNITGSRATFDTFVSSSALNVTGNTQMGGTLNVEGLTTINNNLTVTGTTNANGSLNVTGSVNISGATSVTGALNVSEDTTFQKDLYVSGNIYQTGSFYTQGDIVLSGSINIGNSLTGDTINFGGEVNSHIIPTTNNTYDLGTSAKAWKDLYVSGTAYIDQLNLGSIELTNLDLPGYLNVTGATTLYSATTINAGLTVTGTTDLNGPLNVTGATTLYSATTINADLTVTGNTTLSGSVYVEDLTEKRLVVVGVDGLLTDYTGLTFDNGNLNVSGAIEVTNIQGTGSLYLKPNLDDPRLFEIYNSAAPSGYTDIHFVGNADFNFFGDDTNYLKIDDTAQTVSIVGVNGVFVSSSLTVTGSVNINGNTSLTGSLTVASGSATMLGGDLFVSGNLQVLGSQTNVNIESHTVDIGDNIIQVNAYSPFQRYAGLSAYDSGSVGDSGSLLWDSTNDYWLFQNANGTSSKIVGVSGGTFGSEASLTSGTFPIATTGNTIGDSLLTYSGTTLSLNGKFSVDSGSGETKIQGNLNISYSGATMTSGVTSNVLFINSNDDLGFISSTDTTSETDRLLGYNTSTGNLEFSSLIDGGTY
jgi:cytoskeletal protein CcmA (bactofilin family)